MVHAERLPKDKLPIIDRQVATRLRNLAPEVVPPGADIRLGDSFALWMLGADKVVSAEAKGWPDLVRLATPLDRWHHQILVNGKARAFFESAPSSSLAASALFVSPVAPNIDKTFAWIKENVEQDFLISLLEIPAYYVVAFWMVDERKKTSQVVVIDPLVKLQDDSILTSRGFLKVLQNQPYFGAKRSGAKKTRER
jgi:hypothetical protein